MKTRTLLLSLAALALTSMLAGCIFVEKGGRGGHCCAPRPVCP